MPPKAGAPHVEPSFAFAGFSHRGSNLAGGTFLPFHVSHDLPVPSAMQPSTTEGPSLAIELLHSCAHARTGIQVSARKEVSTARNAMNLPELVGDIWVPSGEVV